MEKYEKVVRVCDNVFIYLMPSTW